MPKLCASDGLMNYCLRFMSRVPEALGRNDRGSNIAEAGAWSSRPKFCKYFGKEVYQNFAEPRMS